MRLFLFALLFFSFSFCYAQDTTRLSMLFLGDIMQHDSQISDAWDPGLKKYNYDPCFQYVAPYTQAVDLAIGNLELTLAGRPYKGYPQFSAPDELLLALKKMGLDVLVTANNHCVDRGRNGVERTIRLLDSLKIPHTGTFKDQKEKQALHPLLIEKNGFRLALLNYTYGTNGLPVTAPNIVNVIKPDEIVKDLVYAKTLSADMIIVFVHWGAEYQSMPSQWQKDLADLFFKNGAQLVIGAHPHVIQPMEWRKDQNKLIAYSLGNFVSGQRKRYTDGGAMIRLELQKIKTNDNSSTIIDTAGYILQYVQRTTDAQKNYFIWPAPTIDANPAIFHSDKAAADAYKTFVDDSRKLLNTHNVNIAEYASAPRYTIELEGTGTDTLGIRNLLEAQTKIRLLNDVKSEKIIVGPFTLPDARHVKYKLSDKAGEIKP
jgi:poly-gamma-glutamate capsule biosynthesis protein CapA/YwtB (metallophosphatase superfamily)